MRVLKFFLASIMVALFTSLVSFGQATLGIIAGSVTDNTGAVVVGAEVSVQRTDGGEIKTTKTGASGDYRVESLTPGTYRVTVSAENFTKAELSNISVNASITTPVNVRLSVGAATETVTVDASVPQVQTETGQIDNVIPTAQVRDLAIPTGNPYLLAETLPGVIVPDPRGNDTNGAGFSVNGLRSRANNFLIDGFDNNDYGITGQALQPTNQEAVSSVTVLQNAYAAEYGRGGGSVSNLVFKSGTNSFHGALWEQYSGSALNAVTAEQQQSGLTSPPHQVNNLFGFTIGGPVVKNKLFFFGTSQWTRQIGAQTTAATLDIPTANGIATLQQVLAGAAPGSPQANNVQILLSSLGGLVAPSAVHSVPIADEPGCTGCSVEFGNFTRSDPGRGLSYEWTARADYTPSSADTLFARFTNTYSSLTPDLFANNTALPTQDTFQGGPARNLGIMWAHTFSPAVLNEFRFSAQTIAFAFAPTAKTLANPLAHDPSISFTTAFGGGVVSLGGFSIGTWPQGRQHQTYQFQDGVSVLKGKHSMKFGADLTILSVKDEIPFNSDGLATIAPGGYCTVNGVTPTTGPTNCTDLANYIDDFTGTGVGRIEKQFGNPNISVPTNQQGYYGQDSWKIKPNFTLNYGLRYEYQPPDAENVIPYPAVDRATVLSNPLQTRIPVKPYRKAWGPRLGFSYSPKFWEGLFGQDKTVIRGGGGVFYDTFYTNISVNAGAGSPNTLGGTESGVDPQFAGPQGRGVANALQSISSISPTADPLNTVFTVVDNLRNPKTYQWNLNVQRELPGKFIAQVAYVGTRGEFLYDNEQLNPGVLDPVTGADNRVNPNKGSIIARANRGDSNYHGLQVDVDRNVGRLSFRGTYTYSHSIDNASDIFTTSGGSSFWQDVHNPMSDRGNSLFDRKHVAAFTWVYALPSPSMRVLNQILGGWETSGTILLESGTPETLYFGGFDVNGDIQGNDRPSVMNPKAAINVSDTCLSDPTCVTGIAYGDPANGFIDLYQAFSNIILPVSPSQIRYWASDLGQNGTLGRNSIRLPGLETYNLSVLKNFKIHESHTLQFRADFLNAFNHMNAGQNNISGYGNLLNPGAGVLGPKYLTLDGGRSIQIWAKYSF